VRAAKPLVDVNRQQALLAILTLVVGSAVYAFRCRSQFLYGWVEIGVGLASAAYVANTVLHMREHPERFQDAGPYFGAAAGLYVIVLGWDNVYKSLKWGSLSSSG
jgi:hypothetical protein